MYSIPGLGLLLCEPLLPEVHLPVGQEAGLEPEGVPALCTLVLLLLLPSHLRQVHPVGGEAGLWWAGELGGPVGGGGDDGNLGLLLLLVPVHVGQHGLGPEQDGGVKAQYSIESIHVQNCIVYSRVSHF